MVELISRETAKAAGIKQYFTGEPCKHGHIAKRFVMNNRCAECLRLYTAAHQDKINLYMVEYRRLHKSPPKPRREAMSREEARRRERERHRRARAEGRIKPRLIDPVKKKEQDKRNYQKHRSRILARIGKWRSENPDKYRAMRQTNTRNRRARLKFAGGSHTSSDIAFLFKAQKGKCAYCRCKLEKGKTHVDHIVPLSKGGNNDPRNLQLTCDCCNQRKSARDPIEFAQALGRLI